MFEDVAVVFEGGGMRCLYTAGLLDYFMEQELYFPYIVSVSAGAYAAMNYLSRQIGRTKACNVDYIKKKRYISWKNLFLKGHLFDMDLLFNHLPNEEIPFDYDRFFSAKEKLVMGVSNCETGEINYPDHKNDRKLLMNYCQASNSLPFVADIVRIGGVPYMDGGVVNPIPIQKAIDDGYKKFIIILTQLKEFRKEPTPIATKLARMKYGKFPKFVDQIKDRPERYNKILDFIEELEAEGSAYVVRPTVQPCSTAEQDIPKLTEFYRHGYDRGEEVMKGIHAWYETVREK